MYLGIDIGTTATKAILVDGAQGVVGRAQTTYPTSHPTPGLAEQDPALWVDAASSVLDRLRTEAPRAYGAVEALGLSGQMHTLAVFDADDRPLRPAILWNDTRGTQECAELTEAVANLAMISGVVAMPSFTAPKLLWLRHHEPEVFARIRHILPPKDVVRLWLTGERATDMSDAAGTQMLDQQERRWSEDILAALGLTTRVLPRLCEGVEIAGRLRTEAASRLGLRAGIPVAAGGGDAGTGAVGLGCVEHGSSFMSLGTGATFSVAQNHYAPRPDSVLHDFAHCVPGMWFQMAAMLNGASCLAWAAQLMGRQDIGALLGEVETRYAGPSRVLFLPYLNGERTPHNDTDIRGSFIGLDPSVDAVDVAQAVLEGVAFVLRDAMGALEGAGCWFSTPGFIGGGARSLLWARIIATVLERPIQRYEDADLGPSLGAARLAIVAATGAAVAEVARPPAAKTVIDPDAGLFDAYSGRYRTFRALYPALKRLP